MDQAEFSRHVDDVMSSENVSWEKAIVIVCEWMRDHDS